MERQPSQSALQPASAATDAGWPAIPPVPTPVKPPEPREPMPDDVEDSPTVRVDPTEATLASARPPAPAPTSDESPVVALQRSVRRQQAQARKPGEDLVWQPRFAYTSALVIFLAFVAVSLPLWLVLYRMSDIGATNGGPRVGDLVALCMMLMGGFLTCAAAWVIIIEMRGRVRMVDTLAKSGEREAMMAPEIPVLDAPLDTPRVAGPAPVRRAPVRNHSDTVALIEAQQASATATLEASGRLLAAFSSVLKSFGQLWAQVAMLIVALALFVGATVLSLH